MQDNTIINEGSTPALFEDLPKGTYIVREVVPGGYESTGPTEYGFIVVDEHLFHKFTFSPFVVIEPVFYRNQQIFNQKNIRGVSPTTPIRSRIPSWNIKGRPKNPKIGTFGFNVETNNLEMWNGDRWFTLPMTKI